MDLNNDCHIMSVTQNPLCANSGRSDTKDLAVRFNSNTQTTTSKAYYWVHFSPLHLQLLAKVLTLGL